MKTWKDLKSVETPARVAELQKDERGYPIPHTVQWVNGKPDFRVIDQAKWVDAVVNHKCGICGQTLEGQMAFVGGPISIKNRLFADLPMHKECAEYAVQVCPFIAMPKFKYAAFERIEKNGFKPGELQVISSGSSNKPEKFGLGLTDGFQVARVMPNNDVVLMANDFSSIDWWVEGVKQ